MPQYDPLPSKNSKPVTLPEIELKVLEDRSPPDPGGFLRLERRKLVALYPDGSSSAEFFYDSVARRALDAVVLCAHFERAGVRFVYLRSALRPPVTFRNPATSPVEEGVLGLWELPAGLVEVGEQSAMGVLECGRRELAEELGFAVNRAELRALGPSTFPCAGVIGERHFFLEVEVDPDSRGEPALDGSALEAHGEVIVLPLQDALSRCRRGEFPDAKTELGLRRLSEAFE
jgi:ADP-ribose pyrophosphatase